MSGTTCARCKRSPDWVGEENELSAIVPLCPDCERTVMMTQLPEIRAAILAVING